MTSHVVFGIWRSHVASVVVVMKNWRRSEGRSILGTTSLRAIGLDRATASVTHGVEVEIDVQGERYWASLCEVIVLRAIGVRCLASVEWRLGTTAIPLRSIAFLQGVLRVIAVSVGSTTLGNDIPNISRIEFPFRIVFLTTADITEAQLAASIILILFIQP
jgi:hypothetical protein